jgi:hypothetical protein
MWQKLLQVMPLSQAERMAINTASAASRFLD